MVIRPKISTLMRLTACHTSIAISRMPLPKQAMTILRSVSGILVHFDSRNIGQQMSQVVPKSWNERVTDVVSLGISHFNSPGTGTPHMNVTERVIDINAAMKNRKEACVIRLWIPGGWILTIERRIDARAHQINQGVVRYEDQVKYTREGYEKLSMSFKDRLK